VEKKCPKCESTNKGGVEWLGTDMVCYWVCLDCQYKYLRHTFEYTKILLRRAKAFLK